MAVGQIRLGLSDGIGADEMGLSDGSMQYCTVFQISMSDVSDSGAKLQSLPFHPMCVERTVVS